MLGDDRGQSIQIGAILLFGILIIGLALFQTVVVPAENEGVEFNGYVETTEDLVTFRNDLVTAGTQGSEQAEAIQTGVRYPSRAVLINPGPPVGSLRTTAAQNVSITGADVVDGEEANARGYWSATEHNYSTQSVRFSPAYNTIDVPSIETTGSGVYRLTDNGPVALTSGAFISGNRLTIVTVEGDISTSSMTTSVAATPASVATRSVTLRERSGEEFNVTIPVPGNGTDAAAVAWNDSRASQSLRSSPSVEGTAVNGSRVDVTLDGSETYELRLARVVVHDAGDSGVDVDTDPQYLVPVDGNGTEVPTEGNRTIRVEVRDKYNNPVSGADVEFTATGGTLSGGATTRTVTTGSEGLARAQFDIGDDVDTANLTARIDGEGVAPYNETLIRLVRQGTAGGAGTDKINPSEDGDVQLVTAVETGNTGIDVTFNNTGSTDQTIEKLRISFYFADQNERRVTNMSIDDETGTDKFFDVPGTTNNIVETFPANQESTISLNAEDTVSGTNANTGNDFFVVTIWYDDSGRQTYFIGVVP